MYLPINVVLIFADVFTFPCCVYMCAHIYVISICAHLLFHVVSIFVHVLIYPCCIYVCTCIYPLYLPIYPCCIYMCVCIYLSMSFLVTFIFTYLSYIYLTIIPRGRVGYEMIDSQRGA